MKFMGGKLGIEIGGAIFAHLSLAKTLRPALRSPATRGVEGKNRARLVTI